MIFFPASIGLDISDSAIKAVALKKEGAEAFTLLGFGREYLKEDAIEDGAIKNSESFLAALNSLFKNQRGSFPKGKYLVVSLPEEKVFLRILELPGALKKEELSEALKYELEANIPMSLDEVYYDYEILPGPPGSTHQDIMVNAAPKRIVDSYVNFFGQNGYRILALESESFSARRSLFTAEADVKETVLVLDIGAARTRFMIVAEGVLRFTSSNVLAGDKFSQLLTERFPLNLKEAEFMKRMVGLDKNQEKGRELLDSLRPALAQLKEQIQNYLNFFETHPDSHKLHDSAQKISKIILIGGGATLWGLTDWLSSELGLAVILGNPIKGLKAAPGFKLKMSLEDSLSYASAIGLALRPSQEFS